jgi:hypothetical protein
MKRYLRHILILIAAVLILAPSCRKDGPRVIPRSKLAKIYAEIFVTDQWIQSKPGLRTIADTSLVYEPILEKYGYDSEDYQHSVDHYMDDPERFSRILRSTAEILDKEIKALRKKQAEIKLQEAVEKEIAKFEINMFQFYDELISEDGLRGWSDSLDVVWDTTFNAYRFRRMPRTDTIYEGPRMIVKDTVVVDSLAVADSLKAMPEQQVPTKQVVDKVKKFPAMNLDTMMKAVTPMEPKKRLGAPIRRREK